MLDTQTVMVHCSVDNIFWKIKMDNWGKGSVAKVTGPYFEPYGC